jgi:hypothetical protein
MITVTSNLESRSEGIDFLALPKRYQDAATLCHLMGERYIWIDSFCIIQVCDIFITRCFISWTKYIRIPLKIGNLNLL